MAVNNPVAEVLYELNIGRQPDCGLLRDAFLMLLTEDIQARDAQLGAFLGALMVHGVTADQVVVLISTALNIDGLNRFRLSLPRGERLVAVAGSGKKGFKLFNVSTPSCIVAAAAGAYVVKPASRATSSVSGSIDFLRIIDAKVLPIKEMSRVILETGFGFISIEDCIPKFNAVYGGKTFGPTPLSFALPAIANPFVTDALLYGLSHPNVKLSAEVLSRFRVANAMIVSSTHDRVHYIDELAPVEHVSCGIIENDVELGVRGIDVADVTRNPLPAVDEIADSTSLLGNARMSVLAISGKDPGPREDMVALNSAAILVLAKKASNLHEGFALARETIRNGGALRKLSEFIEATGGNTESIRHLIGG